MIDAYDNAVNNMMQMYGTTAYVICKVKEEYDPETRENVITTATYKVRIMAFDYLDKNAGAGTEKNTLIRTGDKQIIIQPPHKTETGIPLPHLDANKDVLKINGQIYKIVAVKEYNMSMSRGGCVLYEAYIRTN